ncbi:MarR family transcriptional regulator [Citricoccus sp. I39-566]|uniref:MarR family winged helix-turn-helix transcriptional regulator n=1 Tax=Citricoccus sp. I39-566 TaxID=3073268 RepID=UPI00286AF3DB|nr:MarR family transcriptional regulator [Citricoccus sp. I39-566]WMY78541.1 MarR family transcriptional regulator [Citricoccus sp. I39-566]
MANPSVSGPPSAGYWYDEADSAVALLQALRRFRSRDQEMRRRMGTDMALNATDIEALRYVIAHELAEDHLTPRELAKHLHISTASTAKMLNRLSESGHLQRAPHPDDRRSVIVTATDHAHAEVRQWLTGMHQRMLEVALAVPEGSRPALIGFLESMANCLAPEGVPATPGRPRED